MSLVGRKVVKTLARVPGHPHARAPLRLGPACRASQADGVPGARRAPRALQGAGLVARKARVGLLGPHTEAQACARGCLCISSPPRLTLTSSWDSACPVSPPPAARLLLPLSSREPRKAAPVSWLLMPGRGCPVACEWVAAVAVVTCAPIWQTCPRCRACQLLSCGEGRPTAGLLGRPFLWAAWVLAARRARVPRGSWPGFRWCLFVVSSCVPASLARGGHSLAGCPTATCSVVGVRVAPCPGHGVRQGGGCDVGFTIPHSPDLMPPPPAPLACRERSVRLSFPVWPVPSLPGPTSVLGKGAGRPLGEAPRGGVGGGSPGGDTLGWGARPCALPGQPGERRADSAGPRSRPRNRGLGWEAWGALSFLCISWGPSPWVSATGTSGAAARGQADQSRAPAPGETEAGPRGAARMSLPPPPAPAERPLGPKGARGRQGATRRLLTRLWLDSAPYGNCPRCQESPWLTRRHHFLKVEALGEVGAAGD